MPTTRRSRTIAAPPEEVWSVISEPHHLPRWWPRVARVEGVDESGFTEVLTTAKGRAVRADFRVLDSDAPWRRSWAQETEGTPFARLLAAAETEVRLEPAPGGGGTRVTLELRQSLNGVFSRFGTLMVRRAAGNVLDDALDGLARIVG